MRSSAAFAGWNDDVAGIAVGAPRVLVVCTDYGPPWNEGEKNIVRAHGVEVSVCAKVNPDPALPAHHRPSPRQLASNLRFWARVGRTAHEQGATIVHVLTSLSSALERGREYDPARTVARLVDIYRQLEAGAAEASA